MQERYTPGDYRLQVSLDDAKAAIQKNFADFEVRDVKFLGEGMGSAAILVNNEFVFKFPKHTKAAKSIEYETRMLPDVNRWISSTEAPRISFFGRMPRTPDEWIPSGFAFIGYRRLPGWVWRTMTGQSSCGMDRLPQAAEEFARLMAKLRGMSVPHARGLGVREINMREHFSQEFLDAQEHAFPVIHARCGFRRSRAQATVNAIEKAFRGYLDRFTGHEIRVIHGDLEYNHILWGVSVPGEPILASVLDWGGCAIADPDLDLWRCCKWWGKEFEEIVLTKLYPKKSDVEYAAEKLTFFQTAQLVHRLVRPILLNDEENIEWALNKLHAHVKAMS